MRKYLDRKECEIAQAKPGMVLHDVVKLDDEEADDEDDESYGIQLLPPGELTKEMNDVTPPEDDGVPVASPDSVPEESGQPQDSKEEPSSVDPSVPPPPDPPQGSIPDANPRSESRAPGRKVERRSDWRRPDG